MNKNPLILIVEDEDAISGFISTLLTANDYSILKTARGKDAISLTASYCPDLILLDLGLPDINGIDVIKSIREWSTIPIIIVSARGHEREKVEALDLGADDYITKPFGTSELLARIRTEIRHSQRSRDGLFDEIKKMTIGEMEIKYESRRVYVRSQEIHLTPIEYKIIHLLSQYPGKVLTYEFIMKGIWGPYSNEIQSLRVNMANLRRKIEENPAEPRYIITELGVGYRLADE
jgi:two-component system, OmpR family, KDP operon response regulator KdpE